MPSVSRLTDMWVGICCCHPPDPCIPMGGTIVHGSIDAVSASLGVARLTDLTIGWCGHSGNIVTSSLSNITNGRGKGIVTSMVTGCNIGVVVTGNSTHNTGY